jgi:hypothetical protein
MQSRSLLPKYQRETNVRHDDEGDGRNYRGKKYYEQYSATEVHSPFHFPIAILRGPDRMAMPSRLTCIISRTGIAIRLLRTLPPAIVETEPLRKDVDDDIRRRLDVRQDVHGALRQPSPRRRNHYPINGNAMDMKRLQYAMKILDGAENFVSLNHSSSDDRIDPENTGNPVVWSVFPHRPQK